MAESKNAKNAAKAAAASAAAETTETYEPKKREHKVSRWTPETCARAAKRFDHREAWQVGHPSSYKAAAAKGWMDDCCKHMTGKAPKAAAKAPAKTKVAAKAPAKKKTKTA